MDKNQFIFNLRMVIAATRQALRDSDDADLTDEQIDQLLDRLNKLTELLTELNSNQ